MLRFSGARVIAVVAVRLTTYVLMTTSLMTSHSTRSRQSETKGSGWVSQAKNGTAQTIEPNPIAASDGPRECWLFPVSRSLPRDRQQRGVFGGRIGGT
jgi:hypothetical protein